MWLKLQIYAPNRTIVPTKDWKPKKQRQMLEQHQAVVLRLRKLLHFPPFRLRDKRCKKLWYRKEHVRGSSGLFFQIVNLLNLGTVWRFEDFSWFLDLVQLRFSVHRELLIQPIKGPNHQRLCWVLKASTWEKLRNQVRFSPGTETRCSV